ncbi:protein POLR1D [Spea bombifrons]|uniref:protein POLR1D n=1 Tax=Spea bombifrons TaxID=233779 RepID=UPI00234B580F|nr:protein POLR1D [Spea bombifrons]
MAGVSDSTSGPSSEATGTMQESESELEREAVKELLSEAKRGKIRSETMGAMGWMKCPLASTNKRFLINTIKNTMPLSKEQDPDSKRDINKSEEHGKEKRDSRTDRRHPYKSHGYSRRERSPSPSQNNKRKEEKTHK